MRMFEARNPDKIHGMVFVDPVNPNNTEYCNPNRKYFDLLNNFGMNVVDTGLVRVLLRLEMLGEASETIASLPDDVQDEYKANINKANYFRTGAEEWEAWGIS